jgi:putative ABC transport system permease protein
MLRHALYLALRYLASSPGRSAVLVLGSAVALFLPLFTGLAAERIEGTLMARAESSPVVIGAKGDEFDLTMGSLYFHGQVRESVPFSSAEPIHEAGYGLAVPLYVQHSIGGSPLVGTTLDYFEARELRLWDGRKPALLGEVVAGSTVAEAFQLQVGDSVRSDLSNLYNIAGAYPILLQVVGILEPTGTPDDEAFFTDVKTTWVLDGHLHGHEEVTVDNSLNGEQGGENLEATAAIFMISEITDDNRASFHFHGDLGHLPVTSVLVFPDDQGDHDLLLGDYALHETQHAVRPVSVVREILGIVLRVREALDATFLAVALSTLAFFGLVLSLSLRLRRSELTLMRRIGCSRGTIATMVGAEVLLVVAAASFVAGLGTFAGLAILDTLL